MDREVSGEDSTVLMYTFKDQLAIGEKGEGKLDDYFAKYYDIEAVVMPLQKLGVDRIFFNRKTGGRFSVEYKTDLIASTTRNFFLEIRVNGKPGWLLSSVAQLVIYYAPPYAYVLNTAALRADWSAGVISGELSKPVQNDGYVAEGILVPIPTVFAPALVTIEKVGML